MKDNLSLIFLFISIAQPIYAIEFIDTTEQAGINYNTDSFGSSWADINNDGWPDLWLGNHGNDPQLYINNKDGTFTDKISTIIPGFTDSRDMHGAAFADYDNDGDQDLFILTGSNFGTGSSPNYLYVNETNDTNETGVLVDVRGPLDYPLGRGRTPLWFDSNNDGFLDVLIGNTPRPDDEAPTALFTQSQGEFINTSQQAGITSESKSNINFVQLLTIGAEYRPSLVLNGSPFPDRLFDYDTLPFDEIKNNYAPTFENIWNVQDAVIADLDGNQLPDIFVVRTKTVLSELLQPDHNQINASLVVEGNEKSFSFKTNGSVEFQIYPYWRINNDQIFIGENGINPTNWKSTLSPSDAVGQYSHTAGVDFGVYIGYDEGTQTWQVSVSNNDSGTFRFELVIIGENTLENVTRVNFEDSDVRQDDRLILQYESGFINDTLAVGLPTTACDSVVAADFDNDMDLDLYLACQSSVSNPENILYENMGHGIFQLVENAGGAGGSMEGRADTVSMSDYNRDGFVDLLVTNGLGAIPFADGPTQLFLNQGNDNNWLEIDLEGNESNRDGIGAYLLLTTNDISQYRLQGGGMHRFTQNSTRIHFGLASNKIADSLVIHWPGGIVQTLLNVPANQVISVKEVEGTTDYSPQQTVPAPDNGDGVSDSDSDAAVSTPNADGGGSAVSIYTLLLLLLMSGFRIIRRKQ